MKFIKHETILMDDLINLINCVNALIRNGWQSIGATIPVVCGKNVSFMQTLGLPAKIIDTQIMSIDDIQTNWMDTHNRIVNEGWELHGDVRRSILVTGHTIFTYVLVKYDTPS